MSLYIEIENSSKASQKKVTVSKEFCKYVEGIYNI